MEEDCYVFDCEKKVFVCAKANGDGLVDNVKYLDSQGNLVALKCACIGFSNDKKKIYVSEEFRNGLVKLGCRHVTF